MRFILFDNKPAFLYLLMSLITTNDHIINMTIRFKISSETVRVAAYVVSFQLHF
ncbi:hypothetical protein CoNPh26_CDS0176 [Staphylococcus phage S-CoN_Ph26]|nr:hypothetical protein CoNPh26_CDS0176 [Staphylococcus phage S-CoN_Ph26]